MTIDEGWNLVWLVTREPGLPPQLSLHRSRVIQQHWICCQNGQPTLFQESWSQICEASFLTHLLSADHAVNGPWSGEQSAHQLWWRSYVPKVSAKLLHPKPTFSSRAGGLDPGLQPRSEGEKTGETGPLKSMERMLLFHIRERNTVVHISIL